MNVREEYARLQRLRAVARQCPLTPAFVAEVIQPFIDKYKNLRLPRRSTATKAGEHPAHGAIVEAVRGVGAEMRRAGVRGLGFHTAVQKGIAALAPAFGYRGFMECFAGYDLEEEEIQGRMDVVWAGGERLRTPTVLFEMDRMVKHVSLRKLQLAEAPHKYWVYFGDDVWGFKTSLQKWDAEGEVRGVVIPRAFVPLGRGNLTTTTRRHDDGG